jgi:diguanylate cyclase (GGDEF)-like protein
MKGSSIRGRLIMAFSALLVLLLTVSTLALHHFSTLTDSVHEFVDHQARLAILAERANQHAQNAAMHLLRLLQTSDREQRVPLYAAMDAALADSDAAIGGLERAGLMGDGDTDILYLVELRARYGKSFQETVELIEIDGLVAARRHFDDKTDVLLKALLKTTLTIAGHQQDLMQIEVGQIESSAAKARIQILGIAVSALLIGALLAILIARGIVGPVQEAVVVAESIAGGNYVFKVPAGRGREMGALMQALDVMRESIASREQRILRLAYVDSLTGLPNRTRFMEALADAFEHGQGVLILLDIDRFAPINNALGYQVGDRMLQQVALRLAHDLPETHFVARLGGDEFAIVIRGAGHEAITAYAMSVLARLREPMMLDSQRLDIDASLGIVRFPEDASSVTAVLRRADLAMSLAKRRHDGYAFAADVADEPPYEQLSLIGEMRDALLRNEFTVYFQPKMELATRRIKGAEALLRWRHPERGLVPPGRFIPFAEQTGFIREITPWLLSAVIAHAAEWHKAGLDIVASANISTLDLLNLDFVGQVRQLLDVHALPPERLCIEITESALMDDPELALKHLDDLAALGVKLSIDDYGSGQASLAYVKNLPVHELKIDRAFVDKVDQLPKNAAIVRSTILLCRELNLTVVAEGAETQDELDWLTNNGCEVVQGYGIARPMPAEEFPRWVAAFKRNA